MILFGEKDFFLRRNRTFKQNNMNKIFHKIVFFFTSATMLALTSCVDFSDATEPVSVSIQVALPEEFTQKGELSGRDVKMIIGSQTITAKTDADGIATFTHITPDVYDITTSWSLTAEEYSKLTGSQEVVSGATVSGSLNSHLISQEQSISLPTALSVNRDIVIGKVFYAGSRDNNNRTYMAGKYVELYNQSDKAIDVSGLYIGFTEAESTPAFTLDNLHTAHADSVILLKQIYRIPADKPFEVAPGASVVICNSAIDHTVNSKSESDLSKADFEIKDVQGRYQNNPAVPAMEMIYQIYNGTSVMNILQSGPVGVVIFRTEADVKSWPKTYAYGKTAGNQWVLCPKRLVLDGMEALRNSSSGIDVKTKRLYSTIDAGYTYINATTGWNGEVVYRKTLKTESDGRKILADTNNSSSDFKVSNSIKPRQYDE